MKSIFFFFLCIFSNLPLQCGETLPWVDNYEQALTLSRQTNKPLILYFTGSDWSGWAMKMKKEILDAHPFIAIAADQFIFMAVDFPTRVALSAEKATQNERLKQKMQINDFPRLVVIDGQERELARYGWMQKTPEKFAQELCDMVARNRHLSDCMARLESGVFSSNELQTLYEYAQEFKRSDNAEAILAHGISQQDSFFLLEKYRLLVEEGAGEAEVLALRKKLLQLDPHNHKKIPFSVALIDFQKRASEESGDPAATVRPLEHYLAHYGEQDTENRWRLEMMIAQFYLNYDQCKQALKHAEVAFETAPAEMKGEIGRSLNYIKEEISLTATAP